MLYGKNRLKATTPENIPSTGRKAVFMARQMGFMSVADFADSLPKRATVADVGAGLSRFGHEVAAQRPDIKWFNIDPCYKNTTIAKRAKLDIPKNLQLLTDDITKSIPIAGRANLVLSYWLLPHLSLEPGKTAYRAVTHMYDMLKPGGRLIIGPVRNLGFGILSPYRYKGVATYTQIQPRKNVAAEAVEATQLWWLPKALQRFSNRHQIHLGMRFVGGIKKLDRDGK